MDEYQTEIRDLRRTLARLQADEAPPQIIDEYEAEVRNLTALYQAATETLAEGERDAALRTALRELGFGDWTLTNVYGFVYDLAMDIAERESRDLAALVTETDFAGSLRESMDGDER